MTPLLMAQGLMLLSSFMASIGSLDLGYLLREKGYYHWTQLLLSNGVVGCAMCVVYWVIESCVIKIGDRKSVYRAL